MTTQSEVRPGQDILCLLATAGIPEEVWEWGDDLCDCTFQRIGDWTNPYIGRTMRVRLCCIWAAIYKQYPQFVQEIPAYYDRNKDAFQPKPMAWNSEDEDMPVALWHRQVAVELGVPLEKVRKLLAGQDPPKRVPAGQGPAGAVRQDEKRKWRA